ncbi:hypothetical protein B4U79_07566 [Dinothrombium tinctorium]|uniref:Uncharacterized protein n=1 Tax=Dinothrombium tinctorium TaxID=1965070 RepID=A0A443RHN9_9ACAR|nr:hypothetical protein B4U79_07566 [Dinothrombium tinctorium]
MRSEEFPQDLLMEH